MVLIEKEVLSLIQHNIDEQASNIAKDRMSKDRCMFCRMMFDLFCGKAKRNVPYDTFRKEPYKPEWCPGREPDYKYHD